VASSVFKLQLQPLFWQYSKSYAIGHLQMKLRKYGSMTTTYIQKHNHMYIYIYIHVYRQLICTQCYSGITLAIVSDHALLLYSLKAYIYQSVDTIAYMFCIYFPKTALLLTLKSLSTSLNVWSTATRFSLSLKKTEDHFF